MKEKLFEEMFEVFKQFYLWQITINPYFKFYDDNHKLSERLKKIERKSK